MPANKKRKIVKPGDRLPVAPVEIGKCPVGSCVKDGHSWWLITFVVGDAESIGSMHCRLIPDPDSLDWSEPRVGFREAWAMFSVGKIVSDVRWPVRSYSRSGAVIDPVARMELGDE